VNKQIIKQKGKPAFVVISIEEWRRIEAALSDRADVAAVREFLRNPTETFPDGVVAAILDGAHPIKAMREHRGMSQAELAQAARTSPVYISQIERGKRRAGRALLARLSKALRVEPDLLVRNGD
jgi:ribosome-binding protein aMBF1 (putative translation factor)